MATMIEDTSFIEMTPIHMLKYEAIDRLQSVVNNMPKYKKRFEELIIDFTTDNMLLLINTIYRDKEFKKSKYYRLYNKYFDEIEELTHQYNC